MKKHVEKHLTLREKILETIRDAIIAGALKPGEKVAEPANDGDIKNFFKVHNDFHEQFLRAAGNEKLYDLISNLVGKFQRLRIASLSLPGRMHISVAEHEKIIEAFRKRDAELAEQLVRKNAEYGGKVLVQSTDGSRPLKPAERTASLHMDL